MRRIFGGANLTTSSTSNSLSSDALPSPASQQGPPLTGNSLLSDQINQLQQQQQQYHNNQYTTAYTGEQQQDASSSSEPSKPKGWFESALTGVSGTLVGVGGVLGAKPATATGSKHGASGSGGSGQATTAGGGGGGQPDDDEFNKLPFGAARVQSPPPTASTSSFTFKSPRQRHGRDASHPSARLSVLSGASHESERDALMVDLLSGQAAVEAKDFQILDWDEMQEIKKEHAMLATKTASLSRSLALETKLRDSAAKLVRLSVPSDSPNASSRSRGGSREQAEAQLATATAKVAALSAELYQAGWKEAALRTRLLQHTAAVLALSVRRKEEQEIGAPMSPLPVGPATSQRPSGLSQSLPTVITSPTGQRASPSSPSVASRTDQPRFDGAHFFAGNREAIQPLRRTTTSSTLGSPFTSPQPPSLVNGQFPSSAVADSLQQDLMRIKELESQLAETRAELNKEREESTRRKAESDGERQREVERVQKAKDAVEDDLANVRTALSALRSELAQTRGNLGVSEREVEALKREQTELEREMEALRREEGTREAGKNEVVELNKKLAMLGLEQEEAEHRAEAAEERLADAELDLAQARRDLEAAQDQLEVAATGSAVHGSAEEDRLRSQLAAKTDERERIVQAVGDVLRRHRTRGVVGPVLRDLPPFNDSLDGVAMGSYVSSTLDDHFDALSKHVQGLEQDRDSVVQEHDITKGELRQAVEHRERWRGEAESHRRAKETLEATVQQHETRLAETESAQRELATVREEDGKNREQLAALQTQLANIEKELADTTAGHAKSLKGLQDLWRTIPPLENRTAAANSDDLSVLKTAFETPRRPMGNFLADVTAGKFSVESLTERIRVLLGEDARLVQKLVAFEATKDSHRAEAEKAKAEAEKARGESDKATKVLKENTTSLQAYQKQVKDLEERMEVSANQEVTMLERLNDLTESLEQTRGEKRKIEATLSSVQAQLATAESDKARLSESLKSTQAELQKLANKPDDSAKVAELQTTIDDLRDTVSDLEEELDDAKKREQKQRAQLLEQLSTVEQEVSSLKTQLRQAQRKKT